MKYNSKNNIYLLGKKLGLNYNEIDEITTSSKPEKINYSTGPEYHGGMYGTISIQEDI